MNIEMALKSRSYIFDLDHVKLSFWFFFLGCLIESIFHQLSGSTLIFVKNTHQKAANLMFRLILPGVGDRWQVTGDTYIYFFFGGGGMSALLSAHVKIFRVHFFLNLNNAPEILWKLCSYGGLISVLGP